MGNGTDLSEMTGLCVEEYAHLPQNTSDLVGIAMRLLGEARERIEIFLVVRRVARRGGKRGGSDSGRRKMSDCTSF